VYPTIDPTPAYATHALTGKVALITGASRGIGQAIALALARAGASLALAARDAAALEQTKAAVLQVAPRADVLVFVVDVRDTAAAERAVQAAVTHFGRLDVLVANAGAATRMSTRMCLSRFSSCDSDATLTDAVLRRCAREGPAGVLERLRSERQRRLQLRPVRQLPAERDLSLTRELDSAALPHLVKTNGRIISISSNGAHVRLPGSSCVSRPLCNASQASPQRSDYCTSKLALGRFNEFIAAGACPTYSCAPIEA
jgi:NAD(P)-dependent dehydrogenase (short-subunit alcohol dehydrogenase family)